MTALAKVFLCVICLTLAACATGNGLSEGLDRSVKAYSRMLRWHELENAVMTFSDPGQMEGYLERAETLIKRGLTVTDYRILTSRHLPEKQSGDVVAEFDYYILPSNRVKTVSHRQEWIYRENIKSWKLKNGLPPFE
jgi:hypothetical protein